MQELTVMPVSKVAESVTANDERNARDRSLDPRKRKLVVTFEGIVKLQRVSESYLVLVVTCTRTWHSLAHLARRSNVGLS
jgi:hypothetical protein